MDQVLSLFQEDKETKQRVLTPKNPGITSILNTNGLICAACLLGKTHCAPHTANKVTHKCEMAIQANDPRPGEGTSIDHCQLTSPGHLPHTFGKELDKEKHQGGMLMVDNALGCIFHNHWVSLMATKTVHSCEDCDHFAESCGVKVKGC